VEHASQYEGKDNAPAGYSRFAHPKKEQEQEKKEKPKSEHKVDLIA
jgi:hypothetical protein